MSTRKLFSSLFSPLGYHERSWPRERFFFLHRNLIRLFSTKIWAQKMLNMTWLYLLFSPKKAERSFLISKYLKTNLTLLHLHIVSNDIKTKETNYYSQCLFFHEIQFVSQFPSYNNERCACLSFCLTSNGFIIGSIFSVFTKVRHCHKLISKFRVSNTWTNTRLFCICWVSEWESVTYSFAVFRSVKFSYFLVSQTRQIYFKVWMKFLV